MPQRPKLHKEKGKLKSLPKKINTTNNASENEPSTSSESVNNEEQFQVELVWCIQQLQTTLRSGKLNERQIHDTTKVLNSLMSNSTPIIRKRQLMRLTFGDYRAKMAEEEKKYLNVNKRITLKAATPSKNSMFVKKAPFLESGKGFKFNFNVENEIGNLQIEENLDEKQTELVTNNKDEKKFHFQPSNNMFRFNFDTNVEN